jgi:DNA-binding IscR family transcriptional regulator
VRAGILKGVRGPRGGYELAKERRRITAGDIVRAAMAATGEDGMPPIPESKLVDNVIGPLVAQAGQAFLEQLDRRTVEDICRDASDGAVFGSDGQMADFTI